MTAEDVVFSYHAAMNENVSSPYRDTLVDILGTTSAIQQTGTYGIKFTLPQFYPYVETILLGNPPIVQKAQMTQIPFTEWRTNDTNINRTPVGCGAYQFHSYPDNDTIILTENPYYNETKMGHNPTMIGGGNWIPNPQLSPITFKIVNEPILTVAGLIDGQYDIIDSQIAIQPQAAYIQASSEGRILLGYKWQYHEIGINQMNPLFGMNARDPRITWGGYCPPPDLQQISNERIALNNYFSTFILIPLFLLITVIGLQVTKQVKMKTFHSRKGILLWYIVGGTITFALNMPFIIGNIISYHYDFISAISYIISGGVLAAIWPFYFLTAIFLLSYPEAGYECSNVTPNLWGYELFDLKIINQILIMILIYLGLTELILTGLSRRKSKGLLQKIHFYFREKIRNFSRDQETI
jgi:hypothetical protein